MGPILSIRGGVVGVIFVLLFFLVPQPVVADPLIDEANALLSAQRADDAYRLLEAEQLERAGEPGFDYLLALAAIDSGRYPEAVLALERVLELEPGHAQARAELARAYFYMGENQAAQTEFRSVIDQQPPEAVTKSISRYLNAIEQRFDEEQHRLSGFIELAAGYDSNVNSATSDDSVAVPALGGLRLILDPLSREQDDNFLGVRGGINGTYALSSKLHLIYGGTLNIRENLEQDEFDNTIANLYTGIRRFQGKDRFTLALQGQGFWVDGTENRNLVGGTLQWDRVVNARNQLSAYLQYAVLTYPEQSLRDVDQQSVGGAWVHGFKTRGAPTLFIGAYLGQEREHDDQRSDLGRDYWGLRAGGDIGVSEQGTVVLTLQYIASRYGDDDPLFQRTREDGYFDATLSYRHRLPPLWRVEPQLRYTRNDSNIPINDATRIQGFIVVRRDFR